MTRNRLRLSAIAERELENCCNEGLTADKTRLRLARCGAALSVRTTARRIAAWREGQALLQENEEAEQRRTRHMEAIGRGLGSVAIGVTGAADILRVSLPDWRNKQAGALRDLLEQFLKAPTSDLYSGLAVGMHAFLLSTLLSEITETPNA